MEADKKTTTEELGFFKKYGFYLALAVLAVIVMLPNPEGLSVAGQRMIGIMVFFGHSLGDNGDLVPGQRRRHYDADGAVDRLFPQPRNR